MARITIDQIRDELAKDNWTLISEKYQRLDADLEFRCAAGHTVIGPWKTFRKTRNCPICFKESLKIEAPTVRKQKGAKRVLALDQATHKTGYAIYNNFALIKHGIFESKEKDEIARCVEIRDLIMDAIQKYEIDVVCLEEPLYETEKGLTIFGTLSRLLGIITAALYERNIHYEIIPVAVWRRHCGISGGLMREDAKKAMQDTVKKWYDFEATDDECDAIGIGKCYIDKDKKKPIYFGEE